MACGFENATSGSREHRHEKLKEGISMYDGYEDEVDFDIYMDNAVEDYLDSDEISAEEEGFMLGYLDEVKLAE